MKRKPYRAARTSTTTRATRPREPERSDCTNRVKWDLYRREAPELSLERFPGADDLSFLWWGNPDAKLSIETYRKVQRSVATRNFSDAATDLLRLYKTSAATFHRSGWVCYTVGKLVLEDELATKRFLKTYRKLKRPKQKLLAAYKRWPFSQIRNKDNTGYRLSNGFAIFMKNTIATRVKSDLRPMLE